MTQEKALTDIDTFEVTETLDCSGLLCPLPVYRTARVLNRLHPGDNLLLITTDPGALEDVPALVRQTGDLLLAAEDTRNRQRFVLQKGDRP